MSAPNVLPITVKYQIAINDYVSLSVYVIKFHPSYSLITNTTTAQAYLESLV
jgi:hypothetical protein